MPHKATSKSRDLQPRRQLGHYPEDWIHRPGSRVCTSWRNQCPCGTASRSSVFRYKLWCTRPLVEVIRYLQVGFFSILVTVPSDTKLVRRLSRLRGRKAIQRRQARRSDGATAGCSCGAVRCVCAILLRRDLEERLSRCYETGKAEACGVSMNELRARGADMNT